MSEYSLEDYVLRDDADLLKIAELKQDLKKIFPTATIEGRLYDLSYSNYTTSANKHYKDLLKAIQDVRQNGGSEYLRPRLIFEFCLDGDLKIEFNLSKSKISVNRKLLKSQKREIIKIFEPYTTLEKEAKTNAEEHG